MSRDLTPREVLALEAQGMKNGMPSLMDFMRGLSFSYPNGESTPMHPPEEMAHREQYPFLGKLFNHFDQLYNSLCEIPGGLALLKRRDEELAQYFATGSGDKESYFIKWFEGNLDEHFYYSERNDALFLNAFLAEAREVSRTAPKNIVQEEPSDELETPWLDTSRLTPRSNLRLSFDNEDGKKFVLVGLCYDPAASISAFDAECVYAAAAEPDNIREAQEHMYRLAKSLGIPAYDESEPALIRHPVKVAWTNLGEGISGDYDPKDPTDENLLRFDVLTFQDGAWYPVDNGSHCTCFPAWAKPSDQEQALHILMDEFYPVLSKDSVTSIKTLAEKMSYIGADFIVPSAPSVAKAPLNLQIETAQTRIDAQQHGDKEPKHPLER